MNLKTEIKDILSGILKNKKNYFLHEPYFGGNEKRYLDECITSTFVSSVGKFVDKFEQDLIDYTGAKRAIAVVNGTAALQIALKLGGVERGDEVLVPSVTFIGTANAVNYIGGVAHFVDSEEVSLGIDPIALESWLKHSAERTSDGCRNIFTGNRIKAIVPVHVFGNPCNLESLIKIAYDNKIEIIEDAAESLGSFYNGKHTGTFGKLGTLSFNGNKIVTTGGGGAILTNDDSLADKAKHLTTTAKLPHRWEYDHDQVGYNFRMPNINAALGCAQLEQLDFFLKSKRKLFDAYESAFKKISQVNLLKESKKNISNYWLQAIILKKEFSDQKDSILEETNDNGFLTRPLWKLIHKLEFYSNNPKAPLPVAESLYKRIINLPSGVGLI